VDVAVRLATPADDERIAQLTAAAIAEQVDARGGSVWSRREALRAPDDAQRLIGTIDGAVVGFATVGSEELVGGGRLGIVSAIYVEPGAREVAVGEALLDAAIEWCRESGCEGVDAIALPGNRETKNFFETFGLTARLLVVHKRL
jgi:GNAT superfamily N-acetyltransferase